MYGHPPYKKIAIITYSCRHVCDYDYFFALRICKTKRDTVPTAPEVCKNSALRAPPGARTLDTLIKSQVLYQLS